MLLNNISKSFLLVLSISCVAYAGPFVPGRGQGVGAGPQPLCISGYPCYPQPQQPGYGGGHGPGRPHPRPPMPRPPQQGQWVYDTQTVYVGRAVYNETFYLRQAAGLDGQYRGWEVIAVHANTSPNSRETTTIQLIADRNRVVAQQVNPGRQINLIPSMPTVLDENVHELQLSILGSTVIVDSIVIELRAYHY
ncbi:MAG: hypothetical protein H7328_00975 [Bdellovibrio sp.]|nr:hypothetical protein [Bdellovibrio sp.]